MVSNNISSVLYFNTLENNSENDNANYKVDHEGRPTMKAVTNPNQPNLPPLSEYDWQNVEDDILPISNVNYEKDIEKYFKTKNLMKCFASKQH